MAQLNSINGVVLAFDEQGDMVYKEVIRPECCDKIRRDYLLFKSFEQKRFVNMGGIRKVDGGTLGTIILDEESLNGIMALAGIPEGKDHWKSGNSGITSSEEMRTADLYEILTDRFYFT